MRTVTTISFCVLTAAVTAFATVFVAEPTIYKAGWDAGDKFGREIGEAAGKESRNLELAEVFAPYGYHKIRMAKKDCEARSGMVCKIYGGFAPDIKTSREENKKQQGPL